MSVNDIKTGRYELVAELWDEPKSKPGEPFDFVRHRRGDLVDLDVETARRLVTAGAAVTPGERERAAAEAARAAYTAALAALPPDVQQQVLAGETPEPPQPQPSTPPGGGETDEPPQPPPTDERPPVSAAKAEWVDHAVAQGMSRDDAESATKQELIERYG